MSTRKKKKHSNSDSSSNFELESNMTFQEMKLDVAIKMLKDSGIIVSEDEAAEILSFLNTIAKITIKEFILNQD